VNARPMEGAPDHQYLLEPSRVQVGGWSRPRARRRLLTPVSGGLLLQAKALVRASVPATQEGRRREVTGASEDEWLGRRRGMKNARLEKKKTRTDTSEVRGAS